MGHEHNVRHSTFYGLKVEKKLLTLNIDVDEGKPFFVRRIEFQGNTTTRDRVIRRELLVQEGQSVGGFYTGLEYFVFTDEGFEKTVAEALRYFDKVDRGELTQELRTESDVALREMVERRRAMPGEGLAGVDDAAA